MINFELLFETLERYGRLSDCSKDRLAAILRMASYRKGELITRTGRIFFVKQGVVKWTRDEGAGVAWFSMQGDVICVASAAAFWNSSDPDLEVMEDCELLYITGRDLVQLIASFPELMVIRDKIIAQMEAGWRQHLIQVAGGDKADRVRYLAGRFPGLIYRIDRESLAKFLGMGGTRFGELKRVLQRRGEI